MNTTERAISLLGQGIPAVAVANALGVSESLISQIVSANGEQIAELRYQNLSQHTERDNNYNALEDKLIKKLDEALPLMYKPMDVLRAISVVNSAKRRGATAPEQLPATQAVIQISLPTKIVQHITTNINNQVVSAGTQDLVTMQSATLLKELKHVGRTEEETRAIAPPRQREGEGATPGNSTLAL